jgi:osmotically-inducible protein OsmY
MRNGVVTLSGGVQSWDERCAIINAARRAPGVGIVKDGLAINPPF